MDASRPDSVTGSFSFPPFANEAGTAGPEVRKNIPLSTHPLAEGKGLNERVVIGLPELGTMISQRLEDISPYVSALRSMAGQARDDYDANLAMAHVEPLAAKLNELEVELKNYSVQLAGIQPALRVARNPSHTAIQIDPPVAGKRAGFTYQWERRNRIGAEGALRRMKQALNDLRAELNSGSLELGRLDAAFKELGKKGDALRYHVQNLKVAAERIAEAAMQPLTPQVVRKCTDALPESNTERWNAVTSGLSLLASTAGGGMSAATYVGKGVLNCALEIVGTTVWAVQGAVDGIINTIVWLIIPTPFEEAEDQQPFSVSSHGRQPDVRQPLKPDPTPPPVHETVKEEDPSLDMTSPVFPAASPVVEPYVPDEKEESVIPGLESHFLPTTDTSQPLSTPGPKRQTTAPKVRVDFFDQLPEPAPGALHKSLVPVKAGNPSQTSAVQPKPDGSAQGSLWVSLKSEFDPLHNDKLRVAMDTAAEKGLLDIPLQPGPLSNQSTLANPELRVKVTGPLSQFAAIAQKSQLTAALKVAPNPRKPSRPEVFTGSAEKRLLEVAQGGPGSVSAVLKDEFRDGRQLHEFELRRLSKLRPFLTETEFQALASEIAHEKQGWMLQEAEGSARQYMGMCFQGKFKPDPVDPGQRVDVDRFAEKIEEALERQSGVLKAGLREVSRRCNLSGGVDYQEELLKKTLELKLEQVQRCMADGYIRNNLHYFSGFRTEKDVIAQVQIISGQLQGLRKMLPGSRDLKPFEQAADDCLAGLSLLKSDLVDLLDGGWLADSDSSGFMALTEGKAKLEEFNQAVRDTYGRRVSKNFPACRKRMKTEMEELQSQLSQGLPESRRLGDIREVIQLLQRPDENWDGYAWMQLNQLLNRRESLLKQELFREYATVRVEAQKASVQPLSIMRGQQRVIELLDSEELRQHLVPALRHPECQVLADSADMPELVKMLKGDKADMLRLRRELSSNLRQQKRWLEKHQWPEEGVAQKFRAMTFLLNKLAAHGSTQLLLLQKCPVRYHYPLLRTEVEKLAAQKDGQKFVNPFMVQLKEKLTEGVPLKDLEFSSLCQYAVDVTGESLSPEQLEEMRFCFTQIKQEIKRRAGDPDMFQIDGLDSP